MLSLACRIVALAVFVVGGSGVVAVAQTSGVVHDASGSWQSVRSGVDFATKPGDDFFRYGNGAWFEHAIIPADRTSIGVTTDLTVTAEARTREILERGAEESGDAVTRADAVKINAFYASFLNEARAESLDDQPIAPFLRRIRSAATPEELVDLMGVGGRSFFRSVFGLRITADDKMPDRYVVTIGQGGLGLNRDYYVAARLAEKKAAYRAYATQLLGMIGWEAPEQAAAAILEFETAIAEASWTNVERRDPEKTYNPMTVGELEKFAPFPWRRLLASAGLGGVNRVVVLEDTAVAKIAGVFAQTPVASLKAWQAFHMADAAASYLSKRFAVASFDFHSRTMSGIAQQPERWRQAVDTVEAFMGQAIGRVYVARYFPPQAKAQIETLVEQVRMALKARIERLDWMSPQTKMRALDKLARLNVKLGYPDKWRDYSALEVRADDLVGNVLASRIFSWMRQVNRLNLPVDRDEWYLNPQTVNASYNENRNEMTFPAGILQPPFFDPAADPALNFGGIGAVVGHEMIHGFDDEGRKYDGVGALSNWWTDDDASQFDARTIVLGRQFDNFEPFPGVRIKGDLTMGENIADLGGALVALEAYHRFLGGAQAPVIDGFSGDQRFFLGFALSWREKSTEDSVRRQLVSGAHAPAQYRVNGVVRNMDAWYQAFNVRPGDKLFVAPENRARIW